MKKFSQLVLVGAVLGLSQSGSVKALDRGDFKDRIEKCDANDARCVGLVLIDAMEKSGNASNPGHSSKGSAVFHSDDKCSSESILAIGKMRKDESVEDACKRLGTGIYSWVHSVKMESNCIDIHAASFEDACKRFLY